MPTGLLSTVIGTVPKDVRLLGLDLGTKTIGLALSDPGQSIATPLRVIERRKFAADMAQVAAVSTEYEVGGFIFGWPLNMDGTVGPSCERVRSFADEMRGYTQALGTKQGKDLWIAFFDERLSTRTVEDFLIETVDMSRARRQAVVDKLAAQVILQGALDFIGAVRRRD